MWHNCSSFILLYYYFLTKLYNPDFKEIEDMPNFNCWEGSCTFNIGRRRSILLRICKVLKRMLPQEGNMEMFNFSSSCGRLLTNFPYISSRHLFSHFPDVCTFQPFVPWFLDKNLWIKYLRKQGRPKIYNNMTQILLLSKDQIKSTELHNWSLKFCLFWNSLNCT